MGDKRKAVVNMKRIIEINPDNAHALNFLGYTYAELGENLEEAEALVQKALSLRPNDGYIEDSLGWVLYKKGKVDEAIVKLQHASTLQPEEPIIFEHLGDVMLSRKEFTKAVELYKKSASLASQKKDKDSAKKVESKIASVQREQRLPSAEKN